MENNNKFNKISVNSFILACFSFILIIAFYFKIHLYNILPIPLSLMESSINIEKYFLFLLLLLGFVLGIISLIKTNINKEKGKAFAIIPIILFIVVIIFFINSYMSSRQDQLKLNTKIKYQSSYLGLQIHDSYKVKESYLGSCENSQIVNYIDEIKKLSEEIKCFSNKENFVISVKLDEPIDQNTYFCVDSTPVTKSISTSQNNLINNANTLCPRE